MSIDIEIGFRKKPRGLQKLLKTEGFELRNSENVDGTKVDTYFFFAEDSRRGVRFIYYNKVYGNESWHEAGKVPAVARGTLRTELNRNSFDFEKQKKFAELMREHYSAILYDPHQQRILDVESEIKLMTEAELMELKRKKL